MFTSACYCLISSCPCIRWSRQLVLAVFPIRQGSPQSVTIFSANISCVRHLTDSALQGHRSGSASAEAQSLVQPTQQRSPPAFTCRMCCCSAMRLARLRCCCSCCFTCHAAVPTAVLLVVLAASAAVAAAVAACHQHAFTTAVLASALQQQTQTGRSLRHHLNVTQCQLT
jgi:hypothetical protein